MLSLELIFELRNERNAIKMQENYLIGEIYWVDLPDRHGKEQRGRRPAIIWQESDLYISLPTVMTIPLTSTLAASRLPGTVRIAHTSTNGLSQTSVALVFQLVSCDVKRIGQRLGNLEKRDLDAVERQLRQLLRLP